MKSAIEEEKIVMTAEETAFIDRFVAANCRPHAVVMAERLQSFVAARQMALLDAADAAGFALAAGPSSSEPVPVKAPDEPVTFVFASEGDADAPTAWRAELAVPPGATSDTPVPLKVAGRALEGVVHVDLESWVGGGEDVVAELVPSHADVFTQYFNDLGVVAVVAGGKHVLGGVAVA